MNKKGALQLSIGTVIILVLAMSMLILGLVLVKSILNKPEFKITKEECINKSITQNLIIRHFACNFPYGTPSNYDDFEWVDGSSEIGEDYLPIESDGVSYLYGDPVDQWEELCSKFPCKISKRGCGLVAIIEEVELYEFSFDECESFAVEFLEIYHSVSSISKINCSEYNKEAWRIFKQDGYFCHDGIVVYSDIYFPKDLTIDWLDENCKPYECYKHIDNKKYYSLNCPINFQEGISKYKCNDYTIEVSNK